MPQIDFYLIQGNQPDGRLLTVCRLTAKIYGLGLPLTIFCDNDADAEQIDERLWTFNPGSFIAHEKVAGDSPCQAPVRITCELGQNISQNSILLTLASNIPPEHCHFARVAEIIDEQNEALRQAGRLRYRQYQQQGYPIKVHKL